MLRSGLFILALLAPFGAGCNQSLFDDQTGDVDAGETPGADADPSAPDGGAPTSCPSPCVSSAAEQFALTQGGGDGRWRYVEHDRDALGVSFTDLTVGTHDGLEAWVGSGTAPEAAILSCAGANAGDQLCAGAEDTILFAPTGDVGGATDPGVQFAFTSNGQYRVSGSFVTPDAFSEGMQQRLVVARNGRFDAILSELFATSHANQAFDFEFDAVAGDRMQFDVVSNVGAGIPVGFDLFVTDLLSSSGACAVATMVNDLSNECGSGADGFSDDGDTLTVEVTAPDGSTGRTFQVGDYVRYTGSVMDYSGDFTIQFWMRMPPTTEFGVGIITDWDCAAQGGLAIARNSDQIWTAIIYDDPGTDWCAVAVPEVGFPEPSLNEWHFYRLTRDGTQVRICVDGAQRGQLNLPAENTDMTPINPLYIGRNVNDGFGYFEGDIANFRVYERALPCPTDE